MMVVSIAIILLLGIIPSNYDAASKVKLNKTKCTVYIGKTETLKVQGTSKKVTWTSSNKKIATVSSKGKIMPKKEGKVTITAKVNKKSYTCAVTVKKPYISDKEKTIYLGKSYKCVVSVKRAQLEVPVKTLEIGETFTLKLNKGKIKSVETNDEAVATVAEDGTVTAVGYGQADITITSEEGKTYICKIKVYVEGTPATTISTFLRKKECNSEKESYVYIYATFDGVVGNVGLYDAEGNFLMYFLDDGKYSTSGDDLAGDGIYSTKYYTTWLVEGVNTLYAKANVNGKVLTSKIELNNVISYTSGELSSLMSAKEKLTNDLFFYGFSDLPFDRRKELADTVLADLETEGLIKKDSVY